MLQPDKRGLMNVLRRIGLWFISLLLAVVLFSLSFSFFFGTPSSFSFWSGPILPVIRVTMMFALPVWCLYLPVIVAVKNAEQRRIWTLLWSGSLIGPVSLALWCLILLLRGDDPHTIWYGDPLLGIGGILSIVFAFIVGFLTTSFYVLALKLLHRGSFASGSRFV